MTEIAVPERALMFLLGYHYRTSKRAAFRPYFGDGSLPKDMPQSGPIRDIYKGAWDELFRLLQGKLTDGTDWTDYKPPSREGGATDSAGVSGPKTGE